MRLRRRVVERAHDEAQPAAACPPHRDGMDDLRPQLGEELELDRVDDRQEARRRHEPRVGLHHPAHVLEELAAIGTQRDRKHDRRQVRSSAAERRQLAVGADALEAGHDRDQAVGDGGAQRARQHAAHLRAEMGGGGADAGLGARERARRDAVGLEAEREERRRQRLAGGKRAVRFARPGRAGVVAGLAEPRRSLRKQRARRGQDRVRHALECAHHDDRSQAGVALACDDRDRGRDVLGAAQHRAAELVDDDVTVAGWRLGSVHVRPNLPAPGVGRASMCAMRGRLTADATTDR